MLQNDGLGDFLGSPSIARMVKNLFDMQVDGKQMHTQFWWGGYLGKMASWKNKVMGA
jgi:hypothetical protein